VVLYETLWRYGAVSMIGRVAVADADLCDMKVPRGTILAIPIAMLHCDEEVWGRGRRRVQPAPVLQRFSPRSCFGQDLAMLEAKAMLALVLQRFV